MRIERVYDLTLGCRADGSNEAIVFVQLALTGLSNCGKYYTEKYAEDDGDAASTYTGIILGLFVCLFTCLFCT